MLDQTTRDNETKSSFVRKYRTILEHNNLISDRCFALFVVLLFLFT